MGGGVKVGWAVLGGMVFEGGVSIDVIDVMQPAIITWQCFSQEGKVGSLESL